ncbi:hypothetical protein F5X97DRAFT_26760 [Nemania serpens]|nr:hypothetical protein F5X97DRAFT_26760 [Nemania serpens]
MLDKEKTNARQDLRCLMSLGAWYYVLCTAATMYVFGFDMHHIACIFQCSMLYTYLACKSFHSRTAHRCFGGNSRKSNPPKWCNCTT